MNYLDKYNAQEEREEVLRHRFSLPVRRLLAILPRKYKILFVVLQIIAIISAFAELVSIGALYPFLLAITNPDQVADIKFIAYLLNVFSIDNSNHIILISCICFAFAAIVSGTFRIIAVYLQTKYAFDLGHLLAELTYKTAIHRSYGWHIENNSSQTIAVITQKTSGVVANFFVPLLAANTSVAFLTLILITGLFVQPDLIIGIIIFVVILYYLIIFKFVKNISRNGSIINEKLTLSIKMIIESLGTIRDIIINGYHRKFTNEFIKLDKQLKTAQAENVVLKLIPKYIVELISLVLIAFIAFISVQSIPVESFIAIAGVGVLTLQKVLPNAQSIYNAYASFKAGANALSDVFNFIDNQISDYSDYDEEILTFCDEIKLVDVWFRYGKDKPWILNGINLSIKKGEWVCIIGESGSGKSTLLDIIMGLVEPQKGHVFIDGKKLSDHNLRDWQKKISHVPQNIFLFDASIRENIIIDQNRENQESSLTDAIRTMELKFYLDTLTAGIDTRTGEDGVSLSGGQKQRIGLARAFSQEKDFYVLDEGMSALDKPTKKKVLNNIKVNYSDKTILFSTHSSEVMERANRVLKITNGFLAETPVEKD